MQGLNGHDRLFGKGGAQEMTRCWAATATI
nr:hypothetical protein [Rhizobium sullae]